MEQQQTQKCPICTAPSEPVFESVCGKAVSRCTRPACEHHFVAGFETNEGVCEREEGTTREVLEASRAARLAKFGERNESMFRQFFKQLGLPPDATVLDFGAGDGHLTYSLRKCFPESRRYCLEANEACEAVLTDIATRVYKDLEEVPADCDLIVMNEVIEHLEDPVGIMRVLQEKLSDQRAAIFIATPLGVTHTGELGRAAYEVPSHLHFFTRKSLNYCLSRAGLSALDVGDVTMPIYAASPVQGGVERLMRHAKSLVYGSLLKTWQTSYVLPGKHISGLAYRI